MEQKLHRKTRFLKIMVDLQIEDDDERMLACCCYLKTRGIKELEDSDQRLI